MPSWLVILLLLLAAFIPGRLALIIIRNKGHSLGDGLAFNYIGLTLGFLVLGWMAFLLAEAGRFSISALSGGWLLLVIVLLICIWQQLRTSPESTASQIISVSSPNQGAAPVNRAELIILLLWLACAAWFFFRPHEYINGGSDAGLYVNLGASISDTGAITINDPHLADLDPVLYPSLLRPIPESSRASLVVPYYLFPGLYVNEVPAGQVTPQFYHLHPVWLAVAYSLGGVEPALMMTGLWAMLGGLAVYFVVREIGGIPVAGLALLGMTLNALQVWFARYPTSETLSQYLLWVGIWGTMAWLDDKKPRFLWALLAGSSLGQVLLVRIDLYFLLAIPLLVWLWRRRKGTWARADWWFFAPIGIQTIHSLAHAWFQSRPYFVNLFGYGLFLLERFPFLPVAALLMAAAGWWILGRYQGDFSWLKHHRRTLTVVAVFLVVSLVLFGYFIRPDLGNPEGTREYWYGGESIPAGLDRENLVRLGWYLSPLTIALATMGTCLLIIRLDRKRGLMLGVGLFFSLLYLWRIQANPHQIYAMRRYVPAVLPYFVATATLALGWFIQSRLRWAKVTGVVLTILWLMWILWSGRGFIDQVDRQGISQQIANLDHLLVPESILIFNDQAIISDGDKLGTPLRFLHGHDVYSIRDLESLNQQVLADTIRSWNQAGRQVYWIGDQALLREMGLSGDPPITAIIEAQQLEASYDHKPRDLITAKWQLEFVPIVR